MIDDIDNKDLYELDKVFNKLLEEFPNAREELLINAGYKMFDKVRDNIKRDVKKKTGNLLGAVSFFRGSRGGYVAVKPRWRTASHTHLIENGHRIVTGKNPGKKAIIKGAIDTRVDTGKWVEGKHMYRNALNELADELVNDAEKMIEDLVGDIFG